MSLLSDPVGCLSNYFNIIWKASQELNYQPDISRFVNELFQSYTQDQKRINMEEEGQVESDFKISISPSGDEKEKTPRKEIFEKQGRIVKEFDEKEKEINDTYKPLLAQAVKLQSLEIIQKIMNSWQAQIEMNNDMKKIILKKYMESSSK
jgi:hypothetical protein